MLQIISGNNQYKVDRLVEQNIKKAGSNPIIIDAENFSDNLLDRIMTRDLFSLNRFLIIKNLSSNKQQMELVVDNFDKLINDNDLNLILVEKKLDKRLKLTKLAQKAKVVNDFSLPKSKQDQFAAKMIFEIAQDKKLVLDDEVADQIYQLVGVNSLAQANVLDQLSLVSSQINQDLVEKYVLPSLEINTFLVIDQVFEGDGQKISHNIDKMNIVGTPSQLFWGLVCSQFGDLAMVKAANGDKDYLKIHPYVIQKMSKQADKIGDSDIKKIIPILIATDKKIKTLSGQDWLLIKIALLKISRFFSK